MGEVCRIYLETPVELVEFRLAGVLPTGFICVQRNPNDGMAPQQATHKIITGATYYGIGYERGSWPKICSCLMILHATVGVKRVWYGHGPLSVLPEFAPEDVLEISRHYMAVGHAPYNDTFEAVDKRYEMPESKVGG